MEAQKHLERNSIMWNKAEDIIDGAAADVFLIFDCCNAGIISTRASEQKRFQTLAACPPTAKTCKPGATSFTSALIWALTNLHETLDDHQPWFSSALLCQKIRDAPHFPPDQYPILSDRIGRLNNIVIAPLNDDNTPLQIPIEQQEEKIPDTASYIDLRFHCNELGDDDIEAMAVALNELLKDQERIGGSFPAHRVDFLGKNSVWEPTHWLLAARAGTHWLSVYKAGMRRKQAVLGTVPSAELSQVPAALGDTIFADVDDAVGTVSLGLNHRVRMEPRRSRSLIYTGLVLFGFFGYPIPF
jgi:hypothetical protein